jgi:outer membrane lipoprotein-sorting protein
MIKYSHLYILVSMFLLCGFVYADANEDIKKIDEIRFPQVDYSVVATITSVNPKKENKTIKYDLLVKGRDMAMLKVIEPKNERGRVMLMRGFDMWVYLPTISKPVRLTLRERLVGEVALGDVARANFSGDYDATLLREEFVNDRPHNVYELKAAQSKVMYARVLLWADKETYHPHQAQFFGSSGKLMKVAVYDKYKMMGGTLRPTRLVMNDPINKGQYTVVDYSDLNIRELPEHYFSSAYISRMSE